MPPPRQLVVFSGAGLSADSGVPTYRDAGGLWEGYDFRQLATLSTWRANADAVRRFYDVAATPAATVLSSLKSSPTLDDDA